MCNYLIKKVKFEWGFAIHTKNLPHSLHIAITYGYLIYWHSMDTLDSVFCVFFGRSVLENKTAERAQFEFICTLYFPGRFSTDQLNKTSRDVNILLVWSVIELCSVSSHLFSKDRCSCQ